MKKCIVIIAVVGICLVLSESGNEDSSDSGEDEKPIFGKYKLVNVNNTNVQKAANIIFAQVQKDEACSNFTLLRVTNAEHKNGATGVIYKLILMFSTGDYEIKECKHTIGLSEDVDSVSTAARQINDRRKRMRRSQPAHAQYIEWCTCVNLNTISA
ncbi:hypothetical protein CHS0354_008314 [Potamilus streckersoni]|uniref:Cystatin domain-containing protein n=1 Tax=Potamilus streckersoni TaxID=2493646 RepID=A0AAE0SCM0_9BIVA|nr:hypothetical protein CHS0354_008314 [Potamilus streckersoni]